MADRELAVESVSRREAGWLAVILLLATALRLFRLGTYPFWHDEVHNLLKAEHIGDLLFRGEYLSNHPPLYSILAAGWGLIAFGDPEWSMRMLPALLGVLTVGAVFWTIRLLFGSRVGLFTAFLVAISPAFVTHSQDFKEYMILPLTGTLAAGTLYLAATTNRKSWWAAYTIFAALACYSESFAGPLLIALNVWYMVQARGRLNSVPRWVVSNVVAIAAFAPFLPFLLARADKMLVESSTWWVPTPTPLSVVFYLKTLSFGYSAAEPHFKVALILYVLMFVAGAILAIRQNSRAAALCGIWFVVPVALVYGLSHIIESIFLFRAMLPFGIPFYCFVAIAWSGLQRQSLRVLAAAVLTAVAMPGLWNHYYRVLHPEQFPHRPGIHNPKDYAGASDRILAGWREGDRVVSTSLNAWLTMRWYGLQDHPVYFGAVGSDFIEDVSAGNPRTSKDPQYDTLDPREIESISNGASRIWFVYTEWERSYLPGNATNVWRWLDTRFPELDRWLFEGGELRLYDTSQPSKPFRAVRRDRDDGLGADVYARDDDHPYRLVYPDRGLVAREDVDRRGRLRLSFGGEPSADRSSSAQGDVTKRVTFTLENQSDAFVECNVMVMAVDGLVDVAALREDDKESDVWRAYSHHNPGGDPDNYELHTAVAVFDEDGEASISGGVGLPAGTYDSFVYMLGMPGDESRSRAMLGFTVGEVSLLPSDVDWADVGHAWYWIRGAEVTFGSDLKRLRVQAAHLAGRDKSFCDVGYVGFVRRRGVDEKQVAGTVVEDWPGDVTIQGSSMRSWTLEVDADIGRVDIWVLARGADGKAYHIFEVYGGAFVVESDP